jgi:hypothetical protein
LLLEYFAAWFVTGRQVVIAGEWYDGDAFHGQHPSAYVLATQNINRLYMTEAVSSMAPMGTNSDTGWAIQL